MYTYIHTHIHVYILPPAGALQTNTVCLRQLSSIKFLNTKVNLMNLDPRM